VNVQVYNSSGGAVSNGSYSSGQTYFIRVRTSSSTGGTYWIAFSTSFPPPWVQLPTNYIQLTENQWADGNIPTSSDYQWFRFTATASTQYIHFSTTGTLKDVWVQMYDANGDWVGRRTNLYGSGTNAYTSPSLTPTSGQTYYIRVVPYDSSYSGTYQIGFTTSIAPPIAPPGAIPLTQNQWADGNIPTANGQQWFVFTATASTQYIHFSTTGTLKDVYVQVYASNGTTTVGAETRMYSSTTNISRTLTSGQTYSIRVRPYNTSGTNSSGTYQIAFNTSTTAPTS
jgi:hypothetical protein